MIVRKNEFSNPIHVTKVESISNTDLEKLVESKSFKVDEKNLTESGWYLTDIHQTNILRKLSAHGILLKEFIRGEAYSGVKTGYDEAFVIDKSIYHQITSKHKKYCEILKPYLEGKDVHRYEIPSSDKYVILIPKGWTISHSKLSDAWQWFKNEYPLLANHLVKYEVKARKRYDQGDFWWELRACDYYAEYEKPKILYVKFQVNPSFTLDITGYNINTAVWMLPSADRYLLGILNSNLGWFLIRQYCTQIQGGYQLIYDYLKNIPIRTINFDAPQDKSRHDTIVKLVEQMLDAKEKLSNAKTESETNRFDSLCQTLDRQIDEAVYELYGLTPEEIAIVEGKV